MYLHFFSDVNLIVFYIKKVRTLDAASFIQRNLGSLNTSQKFLNRNLNIVLPSTVPAITSGGLLVSL